LRFFIGSLDGGFTLLAQIYVVYISNHFGSLSLWCSVDYCCCSVDMRLALALEKGGGESRAADSEPEVRYM